MWWCDGARLWKASTRASATRRVRWRGMARWYAYGSVYTDGEYKDVGRGRRSRGAASTGTLAAPSVRRLVEGRQDGRARRVPFCQGADWDGSTLRCCCCCSTGQHSTRMLVRPARLCAIRERDRARDSELLACLGRRAKPLRTARSRSGLTPARAVMGTGAVLAHGHAHAPSVPGVTRQA